MNQKKAKQVRKMMRKQMAHIIADFVKRIKNETLWHKLQICFSILFRKDSDE